MQKQCIFRYVLKDAWYEKLYVIEIYDNAKNARDFSHVMNWRFFV